MSGTKNPKEIIVITVLAGTQGAVKCGDLTAQVNDATGVRIDELPVTPDRIVEALKKKKENK